jgi:hypothetical protein
MWQVNVPAISKHLKNIFEEGELSINSVVKKILTSASDGKNTKLKKLDDSMNHP